MSKKTKQPFFCETQISDGDDDEDYIDKLIKKKGPDALNSLLRDQDNIEEEDEQSSDKEELAELRDSLVPLAKNS